MDHRRRLVAIWLPIGAIALVLGVLVAPPMAAGWRCWRLHDEAPREQARVVGKLEQTGELALSIEVGPHAGSSCTAGTSRAAFDATEAGDVLEVVAAPSRPGHCELVSTLAASARLLWMLAGGVAVLLLVLVLAGLGLTRTFTRPVFPARRMEADPAEVLCPACGKRMDEGYVPPLAGLHWRRLGQPIGLPHALGGLPGTVGWRERVKLHAFRCAPCQILTLQYGRPPGR